jgi:hypothetical protein
MAGNVVHLDMVTKLDLPAERVLQRALEADLQSVVVVGYDKEGREYFASSIADGGTANWLLDRCKMQLLRVPDDMA